MGLVVTDVVDSVVLNLLRVCGRGSRLIDGRREVRGLFKR
jgi:hypothetical protein